MLKDGAFGDAGDTILVEEFMEGEELSLFVDDRRRTRRRSTAGAGSQAIARRATTVRTPAAWARTRPSRSSSRSPSSSTRLLDRIVRPTLAAMRARGTPFTGLLYVGVMLTADGPKVVEFNCRFGDPETQAVLPALSLDESMADAMFTIARGDRLSGDSLFGRLARCRHDGARGTWISGAPRIGDRD